MNRKIIRQLYVSSSYTTSMIQWTACRTVLKHDAVAVCLLQEHVMHIFSDIVMEYRRYGGSVHYINLLK